MCRITWKDRLKRLKQLAIIINKYGSVIIFDDFLNVFFLRKF